MHVVIQVTILNGMGVSGKFRDKVSAVVSCGPVNFNGSHCGMRLPFNSWFICKLF